MSLAMKVKVRCDGHDVGPDGAWVPCAASFEAGVPIEVTKTGKLRMTLDLYSEYPEGWDTRQFYGPTSDGVLQSGGAFDNNYAFCPVHRNVEDTWGNK